MMKSYLNSTDICSEGSSDEDTIILKLQSTDQKWAHFFLNDQASDFKIKHRNAIYPTHRNIIFKNISLHALDTQCEEGSLKLPDSFRPQLVQGVISCLYSMELRIKRTQSLDILQIIHYLHITKLKRIIQEDIKYNFQQYQLFPLVQKSLELDMAEIEELCLNQLDCQSYQQLRYGKYQLLNCKQQTFKYILHNHSQRRWEDPAFGLTDKYIQELIQQYCKHNNLDQKVKNQMIKETGQSSLNTSLPNFTKTKLYPLEIEPEVKNLIQIKLYTPRLSKQTTNNSFIKSMTNEYQGEIDSSRSMIGLTYMGQKKRKASKGESDSSNSQTRMVSQMVILKQQSAKINKQFDEIRQIVEKIGKGLKQMETQQRNKKFKIGEIESLLEQCEKQLMDHNKELLLIDVKIDKISSNRINSSQNAFWEDEENDIQEQEEEEKVQTDDTLRTSIMSYPEDQIISEMKQLKQEQKTPNEKDKKLRVSLIQSKWVCC